ncbi:MAG: B12-binding domain-containing radical SAM protein, partial [Thermodesulfobacteriota bacterium]
HQFMLYTPNAGTPLYEKHRKDGSLLAPAEFSPADAHGQFRFNFRHRAIPKGQEEHLILQAFQKDFERNGPSLLRLMRTMFKGWMRYRNHPDSRVRTRYANDVRPLRTSYAGALWAMR